jgi:proteasome lid subunit RPN8/RPN11
VVESRENVSVLKLPRAVYDAIRAHGEETYPHECCGVLLSSADSSPDERRISAAVRTANTRTDSAHDRYEIAPADLVRIEREARCQGLEIAGFYHSHPDHPAQWSPTDLAGAHWLGSSYVITTVDRGKAAETRSFLLAGSSEESKRFEPETIEVLDADSAEPSL